LAILSKEDEDGRLNNKNQRTKVLSTKLPVDQYDSFNLLAEYLSITGVIETSTLSALLRNSITQLLNSYRNDIEKYRITKKQGTATNQLGNIEKNQILGDELLHSSSNDNKQTAHRGMNTTLVKGSDYLQEKALSMNNQNHERSSTQSTQNDLKESKREMEFLGISEQHGAEDPIANLYKIDLAKFMYTLVMLDRQNKGKLVYLEVDEVSKEVLHIIPSYGLENWKKERADKN
jgi:hypothetical protein